MVAISVDNNISNRKVPTTKNLPCNRVPEISGFDENVKLSIKTQ